MSRFLPVILVASSFAAGPLIALAATPPGSEPVRLAIVPPWVDTAELLNLAQARPVGPVSAPLGVLATDDDGMGDLTGRLRAAGAWAVLDGSALAAICGLI